MHWKLEHYMPGAQDPEHYLLLEQIADDVYVCSDGILDIEVFGVNEIVPLAEKLEATKNDILQMSFSFTNQWAGKNKAFQILGTYPFGPSSEEYQMWYDLGDGQKYMDQAYAPWNIQAFPTVFWTGELGGHSNFPIYTLDDMVGKTYRMGAGIEQDVLKCVGINPAWFPGEEIYGALDRGVVDIIKWGGFTTNWNMKFHEVASHVYTQGWQKPGMALAIEINKDRWEGLSDKLQRIVRLAIYRMEVHGCRDAVTEAEYYPLWADYGTVMTRLDTPSLQKMKNCADARMVEEADANPLFKEIWESHKAFFPPIRAVNQLKAMPILE
jgi:TRAP-type mannitol/chloroaromatic compound transport system substrate-binding protein